MIDFDWTNQNITWWKVDFVVSLFEVHKAPNLTKKSSSMGDSRERAILETLSGHTTTNTNIVDGGFGCKYFTKKTLLTLQLRDAQVQREILLQVWSYKHTTCHDYIKKHLSWTYIHSNDAHSLNLE